MNRDDILHMADDSGLGHMPGWLTLPQVIANLERFAALVAAAEREACARVCEDIDVEYEGEDVLATWCAAAIRARGDYE